MKTKVLSIQIADTIRIRDCKKRIQETLLFSDSDELFYKCQKDQYVYIFKYGVVCFYNFTSNEIEDFTIKLNECSKSVLPIANQVSEELGIEVNKKEYQVDFDHIKLRDNDSEKIRLVMLNLSQSVALDNYSNVSEQILEDTRIHTNYLEEHGKLDIGGKRLKQYIGKVLNVKNKISEHLYIFDSPEITWDDKVLNILNNDLKKKFDLKDRHRVIHEQLDIVKENLELFKDIMFHRQSSTLEWIIIILILVEVVDLFILKLL